MTVLLTDIHLTPTPLSRLYSMVSTSVSQVTAPLLRACSSIVEAIFLVFPLMVSATLIEHSSQWSSVNLS